ncbi:MAG: hypothetical protein AAGN15_01415 [Cyanobacteria bacterium J06581_3]
MDDDTLNNRTPSSLMLGDRFQGALLGVTLAPVAIRSLPGVTGSSTQKMTSVIQTCLYAKTQSHPWLSQLPVLLRYYDEAAHHRHQRLGHQRLAADASSHEAIAYQCFLSDVVSRVLSGWPLTLSWLKTQQQQSASQTLKPAVISPKSHSLYTNLWNDVVQLAVSQTPMRSQIADYHGIIVGTASMVACASSHYSVCVPVAALSNVSMNWEAALVAGLLAGALGGRVSLPVLWQRSASSQDAIRLADQLFNRWAGRLAG